MRTEDWILWTISRDRCLLYLVVREGGKIGHDPNIHRTLDCQFSSFSSWSLARFSSPTHCKTSRNKCWTRFQSTHSWHFEGDHSHLVTVLDKLLVLLLCFFAAFLHQLFSEHTSDENESKYTVSYINLKFLRLKFSSSSPSQPLLEYPPQHHRSSFSLEAGTRDNQVYLRGLYPCWAFKGHWHKFFWKIRLKRRKDWFHKTRTLKGRILWLPVILVGWWKRWPLSTVVKLLLASSHLP